MKVNPGDIVVCADGARFLAEGMSIEIWGMDGPSWSRWRFVQDGDLAIGRFLYRVFGWTWERYTARGRAKICEVDSVTKTLTLALELSGA